MVHPAPPPLVPARGTSTLRRLRNVLVPLAGTRVKNGIRGKNEGVFRVCPLHQPMVLSSQMGSNFITVIGLPLNLEAPYPRSYCCMAWPRQRASGTLLRRCWQLAAMLSLPWISVVTVKATNQTPVMTLPPSSQMTLPQYRSFVSNALSSLAIPGVL